jgi:hypothetical protein
VGRQVYNTPTAHPGGGGTTTRSLLHSFADDLAIVVGSRQAAQEVSQQFYAYMQDFLMDIHVATPSQPKSKSVVLHVPAKTGGAEEGNRQPLVVNAAKRLVINFVDVAKYLGHYIHTSLSDNPHLRSRMGKANQVFGALRQPLFANKNVWRKVKASVLVTMVVPTLLDGAECCAVTAATLREMESMYLRWVRSCLGVTPYTQRKFKTTSEELLQRLGVHPLHHYLDLKVLAYAGHVQRMPDTRLPKITRNSHLAGSRKVGRPSKSRRDGVKDSLKRKEICVETWRQKVVDKKSWAQTIRNIPKSQGTCASWARASGRKSRAAPAWAHKPLQLIGCNVEQRFEGKWYAGIIVDTDIDCDTNETMWRVLYDDGDMEDLHARELDKILCPDLYRLLQR